ncbi:hypothetical protein SNOG_15164 [Parastagonospora nodorum SN15]|uniref:Uncharacterized protein n=1 Tax=Phaeosphaeria nodorum (strain SN15 / ATCC MYA-4574 / FGSC 10173) TaxID=321614 RepID=Q0TZ36_PHANO|nr:hypothetical protein SNOG_15164 [Parastagonospora nodorum SN15]EAT77389.1 hypothetical protein SNOG_15164 [Parastagonospora nodorum SN15]
MRLTRDNIASKLVRVFYDFNVGPMETQSFSGGTLGDSTSSELITTTDYPADAQEHGSADAPAQ